MLYTTEFFVNHTFITSLSFPYKKFTYEGRKALIASSAASKKLLLRYLLDGRAEKTVA